MFAILRVARQLDACAGIDLRDAELHHLASDLGRLTGGQDHACVGHGQAQDGDQAFEIAVAHHMLLIHLDPVGGADAWEADRVRAAAKAINQVARMRDQAEHFEAPVVESKERANADIVTAGFIGTCQSVQPVGVVALMGLRGMHLAVGGVMVGLLEDLVGADARRLDRLEARVVERGGVDVDAPNLTVAILDAVDLLDRTCHELGRVVRVLTENQDQALVAGLLQGEHLLV